MREAGLNCCTRAVDSQNDWHSSRSDFHSDPLSARGAPPDQQALVVPLPASRVAARDGISEAMNDLIAGFLSCSRADQLSCARADSLQGYDDPNSSRAVVATPWTDDVGSQLLADGFQVIEGHDCSARGAGAERMSATDLEACKRWCRDRGYGAFIVRAGMAYFRIESPDLVRAALVSCPGATAFIDTLPLVPAPRLPPRSVAPPSVAASLPSAPSTPDRIKPQAVSPPIAEPAPSWRESASRSASAAGTPPASSHASRCTEVNLHSSFSSQASVRRSEATQSMGSLTASLTGGTLQMFSGLLGKLATSPRKGSKHVSEEEEDEEANRFGGSNPMSTRPPSGWSPSGEPIDEHSQAAHTIPPLELVDMGFPDRTAAAASAAAASSSSRKPFSSARSAQSERSNHSDVATNPEAHSARGSPTSSFQAAEQPSEDSVTRLSSLTSGGGARTALELLGAMVGAPREGTNIRESSSMRSLEPIEASPMSSQKTAPERRQGSSASRSPKTTAPATPTTMTPTPKGTGAGNSSSSWAPAEAAVAATAVAGAAAFATSSVLHETSAERSSAENSPVLQSRDPLADAEALEAVRKDLHRSLPQPVESRAASDCLPTPPPEGEGRYVHVPTPEPATPQEDPYKALSEQCRLRLEALNDSLQSVDKDLKGALPEQWGPIMGGAIRKAKGLDREAGVALEMLPVSANGASVLLEQHKSLHESVLKLEANSKPYMRSPPKAVSSPQANTSLSSSTLSGEAPTLHARLNDLNSALQAWTAAVERSKRELDTVSPVESYGRSSLQHEELMVERASSAFEDFRVGISSGNDEAAAARRNAGFLRLLNGFSEWGDRDKVQELLKLRKQFLTDAASDPYALRFTAGRLFLQQVVQKEKWPAAEPLTVRWREAVLRTLGPRGAANWKERAARLYTEERNTESSRLSDYGTLCIRRVGARNLGSAAPWDETNPYVVFQLGEEKRQTAVVWNNAADPEWKRKEEPDEHETLWFDVEHLSQRPILRIGLFDHDRFMSDAPLGHVDEGNVGGLDLVELLTAPPPLPHVPAMSKAPEQKEGVSKVLQRMGFGKSEEQEAREREEREAILRHQRSAHDIALRERDARHPLEVHDDGSVTCKLRPLRLKGEGAGDRGGTVQFEIFYQTGATGDPLVCQPEKEDDALLLYGRVEEQLKGYEEAFFSCNLGFFLSPADMKQEIPLVGSPGFRSKSSPQVSDEVYKYNRLLDRLNIMTTDHRHNGAEGLNRSSSSLLNELGAAATHRIPSTRDALAKEWTEQFVEASEEFASLLEQVRSVERTVGSDAETRRFFALQDELLPTLGEWSMDRRRRLRNQVFLANLEIERWRSRRRAAASPVKDAWQKPVGKSEQEFHDLQPIAMSLCGALAIYGIAMAALVFGGGWQHQGWVMLLASVLAVVCLVVAGYLYGSRLLASLTGLQEGDYAPLHTDAEAQSLETSREGLLRGERGGGVATWEGVHSRSLEARDPHAR